MAATADINISATTTYTKAAALATYSGSPKIVASKSYATTDISKVFDATGSTGSPVTYDVTALTDDYGAALAMATVKGFVIQNTHATATLTIGGGSNPLFGSDHYTVKAGCCLPITSAFAASGAAKNVLVTPSATATWQVLILGS